MGSRLIPMGFTKWLDIEDVIYHNVAFHFITHEGNMLLYKIEFQNEALVETTASVVRCLDDGGCVLNIDARYLVECRSELLMVLRVQPHQEAMSSFICRTPVVSMPTMISTVGSGPSSTR
ncbi:hypothetical protein HU200_019209 [Digitaria exilis]|uniref:KIB1-4 beta-propeller domain-containing protein n=1 Tax=Digitaria exilis TaxID=1010633 RepID=A0A835F356_9POAL|nr:hypothetical protein HU200_019209 [Digitaria exilis]